MRIIVTGGGTGGHIYPALALINHIKNQNPNAKFLYIGTQNGLEAKIVPRENIPFDSITISGFKRKLSLDNFKTIYRFINGVKRSKQIIKKFDADVVIGTGGYVSGPVVYAAKQLKVPTIIHEQNSVPGLTNKFLSRYVDRVAISFEESQSYFQKSKVVFTGNPRATAVIGQNGKKGIESVGLDPEKKSVVIVGGSRGAQPINNAVVNGLSELVKKEYQVLYITGDIHYEDIKAKVKKVKNLSNLIVKPFIHNMPEVLAGADLIVARAGATTLAEITALGLPSVLIPSPYVTNNHQEKNARTLSGKGAAILRLEKELNTTQLFQDIDNILLNEHNLMIMKTASKELGIPNAAERFYNVIKELTRS